MRVLPLKALLIALALAPATLPVRAQQTPPDLVLLNGKIFTSNASHPYVEALAIRADRIVATGTTKEIAALAGKQTRRIDVGGRTVIPGINDAHDHIQTGPNAYEIQIKSDDPTWKQVEDAVAARVAGTPKGKWIVGTFGENVLDDPQASRDALDALAPDNPVLMESWTGHAALMNTAALRELGVSEDQRDPEGGTYARNPSDGRLTGWAFEFAKMRVGRRFSELVTQQEAIGQLNDFLQRAVRWGITTVQNMADPISRDRCVALFTKAPPPIRVRVMWFGLTGPQGRLMSEGRTLPVPSIPLVTFSGTKWVLDGTPVERSAAMRKPYTDRRNTSGTLNFSQAEMEDMLRESLKTNDQLMVHVVGDRTTEIFLKAMQATGGKAVWANRRVRIEHGDGIMPDLVPKVHDLGIVVVQNPTHLAIRDTLIKRFGVDRADQVQPLRSLMNAGIPVALGSDGPNNPYLNIMLATTYPGRPSEAITREQAVIAYTLTSAYAEFQENDKGSLEPGKLADLAVLSQDIFKAPAKELPKTVSVLTMVDGKIVYDAKDAGAP
jgi:predicted amidohydrolase YtcJ